MNRTRTVTRQKIMQAMVLAEPGKLVLQHIAQPQPGDHQVLLRVIACGVCRTDLHILDGELAHPALPLVPGHEIIARVYATGKKVTLHKIDDIVGVSWLAQSCGGCKYCNTGQENLCDKALFTGYTINGGYAEYCVADERYCFALPDRYANAAAAPLMCAGLIGFRSYTFLDENAKNIGIYGYGAAASIIIQVALAEGKRVFAFTRNTDLAAQKRALAAGATWAGGSSDAAPEKMDAAIIFAPVGELVPKALLDSNKGATIVCGGIHMSDIPSFPYQSLWGERVIRSVANVTRSDAERFFEIAAQLDIRTDPVFYPLEKANEALDALRNGSVAGTAVLRPRPE